jgi:FkbM family methyltransferase
MFKDAVRAATPTWLWRRLRLARIRWRWTHFQSYETTHCYGRARLTLRITDPIAREWYDRDWPEPAALNVFRGRSLRPGAVVFNIGAHQAVIAMMLEREVQPGGRVVAVEANPHNIAVSYRNRELNKASGLEIVEAAAGDRSGSLEFNVMLNGQVDDGSDKRTPHIRVEAITVDDLAAAHGTPDLLFIDVEGYECHVLHGAEETLLIRRPDVFVEVHAGDELDQFGSLSELFALLDGYELLATSFDTGPFLPIAEASCSQSRFFLVALAPK